jgi:hypothetical protein
MQSHFFIIWVLKCRTYRFLRIRQGNQPLKQQLDLVAQNRRLRLPFCPAFMTQLSNPEQIFPSSFGDCLQYDYETQEFFHVVEHTTGDVP